jgi:hypothetical protein
MPGGPMRPQPRVRNKKAHELVTTGSPVSPGIPRAMVLTDYSELSPVTGLFATVIDEIASINLTPASGRQDHTTSPSARSALSSKAPPASITSCPAFVTIASRPSVGQDGERYAGDLGQKGTGIFLEKGLDRWTADLPVGGTERSSRPSQASMKPYRAKAA